MSIIFYDSTTRSGETISTNTWKTKLSLILKRIPFETKRVPLHEVQQILPREGIPPSSKNPDGSPFYTVPAIHDLSTGVKLTDSWEIALYLDKTYPDTAPLFPALLRCNARSQTPSELTLLRERVVGKPFDKVIPQGEDAVREWKKYKIGLNNLEEWYSVSNGTFLMGDTPVWADLPVVAVLLVQRRALGKDSEKWKDVASWNGGRWHALVSYFDDLDIA
ncbi:hypothetical protein D9619_012647 [Psilocybe cf. subviscida]|uniref:GST N-terminal domain-containing protein n=1 Tax=Psilocybe cf. subviscida TaxID=2480587 RepID=A0A8H5EYX0_9AGAR|nr:hypothetical protein D9619_012647 [Psilocybe cf. subviscida]